MIEIEISGILLVNIVLIIALIGSFLFIIAGLKAGIYSDPFGMAFITLGLMGITLSIFELLTVNNIIGIKII